MTTIEETELYIEKIETIFSKLFDEYHNPTDFIAQTEALIQSLRNSTWFLQSKKNNIDRFDEWYGPWQELMRQSPYMRFIVDMRNSIVKQGINTAKSNALVILYTDYRQTLLEKRFDVYTTTDEIKDEIARLAKKNPGYNHATCEIQRLYIFNYAKKEDLEVIDTLFYCYVFVRELFDDFRNFIQTGSIQKELSKVIVPNIDVSDLSKTFRVRDGSSATQSVIRIDRDEEAIEKIRAEHGDIKLKHDINSDDIEEKLRAKIEFAQLQRRQFEELLPTLDYSTVGSATWESMFTMFRNRADKIHFWHEFANKVINEDIDRIVFTTDAYIYMDRKKGIEAIRSGKEISSLPDLKEQLVAYYLDSTGKIITATSRYSHTKNGLRFQKTIIAEDLAKNNAMFTAVFDAWKLMSKYNKRHRASHTK